MDLTTNYLGLTLKHPIVAAASPFSKTIDGIRRLEDAGAAAIVMYSLFEEQITRDHYDLAHYLSYSRESFGPVTSIMPDAPGFQDESDNYMDLVSKAKEAVSIPVIASLNGNSPRGWTHYARLMELAGADGLEMNVYFLPTDLNLTGAKVEEIYLRVLKDVRTSVKIPISMKLSPYFSATGNMARQLSEGGAKGLTLFNRFYQPDFDLINQEVVPSLELSHSYELRLPLHWTAILHGKIDADIALTGGVHTHEDVVKAIMAGASVVQVASELLTKGPQRLAELREGLESWLNEYEYSSVNSMRGCLSQANAVNPDAFERVNYTRVLQSYPVPE